MKYIEGFREPRAAAAICRKIAALASSSALKSRTVSIMEVCGSHTMAIARYGIRSVLPANINLISGPGCPVCVTPTGYIDTAIELSKQGATIATFGDMLNVPGSTTTLAECRSTGGSIEVCYSPITAMELALKNPKKEVVFLAIGFETTIAPVISVVDIAAGQKVRNLSMLMAFKTIPPALRVLVSDPELSIDGFLCPAHVSAIIGSRAYQPTADAGKACVIAGFEPLDILFGIQGILKQLADGKAAVDNQYSRVVKPEGNIKARQLMDNYLEPADAVWRGLGNLPLSGLALRDTFADYDVLRRRKMRMLDGAEPKGCICGDVIKGKRRPGDCAMFGRKCTPDHPVGPCMVSAEGTCAAYKKYGDAA